MSKQTILFLLFNILFLICSIYLTAKEPSSDSLITYQVQKGDNLYLIASKYFAQTDIYSFNNFMREIKKINGISENNLISPNQFLKIPVSAKRDSILYQRIQHKKLIGIYLNSYQLNSAKLEEIITNYDSLDCNAIVLDFKNTNGDILYPTKNPLSREIHACCPVISSPKKLIYLLHKHNIELIARITVFKDTTLASAYPEWTPKVKTDTMVTDSADIPKRIQWVNPNCMEVQEYNLEIIKEVISLGVDEIQLDYLRFPTETHLLNADFGIPDSVSKQQIITNFLQSVYKITSKTGIKLSADIFGIIAFQNKQDIINTGQQITNLCAYFDRVHPMVYPSHFFGEFWGKKSPGREPYYFIYRSCQKLIEQIDNKDKIVPYLQAFSLNDSQINQLYIIPQLQAVRDCGLNSGFLFWNAHGNYKAVWKGLSRWNSGKKFYESK